MVYCVNVMMMTDKEFIKINGTYYDVQHVRVIRVNEEGTIYETADLTQCPCDPACKCKMDEPCLWCETYAEWLNNKG